MLILVAAFAAAALDGRLADLVFDNRWYSVLVAPAIILCIVVVGMTMERLEGRVICSFRALVPVEDTTFSRLATEAARIRPRNVGIAFVAGAVLGLPTTSWRPAEPLSWVMT